MGLGKAWLVGGSVAVAAIGVSYAMPGRPPTLLQSVQGYQTWRKANPKPVRLSTRLDLLCRILTPEEIKGYVKQNPHFQRYITVYVNPIGERAMLKGGTFPVGSIIVKEKRGEDEERGPGKTVILSTMMIKREKGYNPTCGDWEFAAINANATKVDGQGKLDSCMSCHLGQAKKDFVFRTYIGAKEWGSPSGHNPQLGDQKRK